MGTAANIALWKAHWIWDSDSYGPANHYVYFRKVVKLSKADAYRAAARICAWTGYKLYVNGDFVCHGPARSDLRHVSYDQVEIGAKLKPGENVIAALVHFEGLGTGYSMQGQAGFLLEAEIEGGGAKQTVVTDAAWRAKAAPYESKYERMSMFLAYPEDFDAHQEPNGWNRPGYKDDWWAHAVDLGPAGREPWLGMTPRDIPMQRYRTIAPVSMPQVNACEKSLRPEPPPPPPVQVQRHPDPPGLLPTEDEPPKRALPAEEMQWATRLEPVPPSAVAYKHPAHFTVQPVQGKRGVSVVLDYGKEVSGFPWLQIRRGGGGRVDIGYSERIEDDGSINPNRYAGCDVHYADRLRMRPGPQKWTAFHPRAFRYLRLDFYDCPEPVEVLTELDTVGYPVEHRGDFQCSDPLLDRIWETGRYTAELCMDDAYLDGPWRERGQWLANTRIQALVAQYAFGDWKLARRAWRQYAQSQGSLNALKSDNERMDVPTPEHHKDPWIKALYPAAPPFDTVTPVFNLIWISALWEHFLHTGDRALLQELWPNVEKLLALLKRFESKDKLLHDMPGLDIVDTISLGVSAEGSHVNAFYVAALLAAGKIARATGRPDRGGELEMHASDVKEAINELFWDQKLGLYHDMRLAGGAGGSISEQANVLCMLHGVADRGQTARILQALYGVGGPPLTFPERRPNEPVDSLTSRQIVRVNGPYFAFYQLRALFDQALHAQALELIRRHWGRMLARGATTFWEQYEPEWNLCYGWSSSPTYALSAYVAGIRPLQPGFEEYTVDLQPTGLSWLRATVPTIRGDIKVSYHYRTDKPTPDSAGGVAPLAHTAPAVTVNLSAPKGTRAHLSVPVNGIVQPTVHINGERLILDGNRVPGTGSEKLTLTADRLSAVLPGGDYRLTVDRR